MSFGSVIFLLLMVRWEMEFFEESLPLKLCTIFHTLAGEDLESRVETYWVQESLLDCFIVLLAFALRMRKLSKF